MFSCEFCKIFKNTFFTEHFRKTAPDSRAPQISNWAIIGQDKLIKVYFDNKF